MAAPNIVGVSTITGNPQDKGAAGTSRSFDFSNLASEGVSGIEVYKTGRAAGASSPHRLQLHGAGRRHHHRRGHQETPRSHPPRRKALTPACRRRQLGGGWVGMTWVGSRWYSWGLNVIAREETGVESIEGTIHGRN